MGKNRKTLENSLLIILGSAILFAFSSYAVSWNRVIVNRQDPSIIPPPPLKPVSLVGIEKGTGFEVADPIIEVNSGEEYKYLESWTDSWWEVVDEKVDVSVDECSSKIIRKFENKNGNVIQCLRTNTYSEWCPSPIVSYALSSDGSIWIYKEDFPCTTITVPIFFILGIIVGLFLATLCWIISKSRKDVPTNHA